MFRAVKAHRELPLTSPLTATLLEGAVECRTQAARSSADPRAETCNFDPVRQTVVHPSQRRGCKTLKSDQSETGSEEIGNQGQNAASVVDIRDYRQTLDPLPVTFHRRELDAILWIYGKMVGEGVWRDYAIDHLKDRAVFSVFKRSGEYPLYRIEKNPKFAAKQGAFSVVAADGRILKRGHELKQVLKVFDKALKLVE